MQWQSDRSMTHPSKQNVLSISTLLLASSLALTGCLGSSDGSSKDSSDTEKASALQGTWLGNCQFDNDNDRYVVEQLEITDEQIKQTDIYYANDDWECAGTSTGNLIAATAAFSDEGRYSPANAPELELHKLHLDLGATSAKVAAYATPKGQYLIITDSVAGLYPTDFKIDDTYKKQGITFSSTGTTQAVLGHFGFNLKTGSSANQDLYTTAWSPSGLGGDWGTGIWITPTLQDETGNIYISNQGENTLSEVSSIPASWPTGDSAITPVKKGEVHVIKRNDGSYAKLRVLHDPIVDGVANWEILVEYQLMD